MSTYAAFCCSFSFFSASCSRFSVSAFLRAHAMEEFPQNLMLPCCSWVRGMTSCRSAAIPVEVCYDRQVAGSRSDVTPTMQTTLRMVLQEVLLPVLMNSLRRT
jgi:hypothetical protein